MPAAGIRFALLGPSLSSFGITDAGHLGSLQSPGRGQEMRLRVPKRSSSTGGLSMKAYALLFLACAVMLLVCHATLFGGHHLLWDLCFILMGSLLVVFCVLVIQEVRDRKLYKSDS